MSVNEMRELDLQLYRAIVLLDKIVSFLKHWNVDKAMRLYRDMTKQLTDVIGFCNIHGGELSEYGIELSFEEMVQQLGAVMDAQAKRDEILLADMLQLGLRPVLIQWLAAVRTVFTPETKNHLQANLEALYSVNSELALRLQQYASATMAEGFSSFVQEPTESGRNTIHYIDGEQDFYLYGNGDPFTDLYDYMRNQIAFGKNEYHLLGCASPYLIWVMRALCGDPAILHYYESRPDSLCMMLQQTNMSQNILDGRLVIHYDPQLRDLVSEMTIPEHQVIIYPPAIRIIQDPKVRQAINRFYTATHSMQDQQYLLFGNFVQNERRCEHNVDELMPAFEGKKVYIVAAGPSLDKNLHLLANREADSVLIATGTVFRKMMTMGIRPDYVIVSEANGRVRNQFEDLWQEQIPLLLLSTTTWELAVKYAGPKYIIYQEGFEPSEKVAGAGGMRTYASGGSVSTLALDVAIRLKASKAVFIGLDLAFTDSKAHAEGTSQMIAPDEGDLISVKAYDGGTVYADTKFQLYANWITRRLNRDNNGDVENIRVINATEGGAYVKRMEYMTLEEAMQI